MKKEGISGVPGTGTGGGPFPAFLFLTLAWWAPLLPGQGQASGDREEDFSTLFSRAVRALPPQKVVTAHCKCPLEKEGKGIFERSLSLLRRAWRCRGASSKALDLLARDLVELSRVKGELVGRKGSLREGALPPRFRLLLGGIQCAVKIVQWELEKRAREEVRPRPLSSPLTELVSRLLDLAILSPEAGALVLQLLGERGVPPAERACYLRGVHLAFLAREKKRKERASSRPWRSGILEALERRARENQVFLEKKRGRRAGKDGPGASGGGEAPNDWKDLEKRWKEKGDLPAPEAFRERERMVTAFLAEVENVEAALQGADLFYRTYPAFCSLGPRGWPNLAWKKGAVQGILHWIRARWEEPAYRTAVADALQGLWIGGGLVQRRDRILVEEFMVEVWKEDGLPFPIRARALLCLARAVTLSPGKVRKIFMDAYRRWEKNRNPRLGDLLSRAIGVFLDRAENSRLSGPGREGDPPSRGVLEKALRRLSGESAERERRV